MMYASIATLVHGLGYTAPESRPASDGTAIHCVSCHADGTFSYYDRLVGSWIPNDRTVPDHVLEDLPADERNRVMRRLTASIT